MAMLTALPVLLPVLCGGTMLLRQRSAPFTQKSRAAVLCLTVLTALTALAAVLVSLHRGAAVTACTLVEFESGLTLSFRIDGMGAAFAVLVSVLWPLTTVYAFSYMRHEGRERKFFSFFLMSFGVVLGIAFAEDFLTLYIFYELLTLSTLPLVMHTMTPEARWAGRKYLIYSFSGAAVVFAVLVFLMQYGTTLNFTLGGVLNAEKCAGAEDLLRAVFLFGFFGYGVKAAVCPLHGWLPDASVAPTPVTALLHAVAVVKSGVFAIARLIYFGFGADFLRGTSAQTICLLAAAGTILFGSIRALRTPHLKRRLAYSTVSNLSYIVLGLSVMSNAGLTAGLTHMVYHALLKIVLFFCAGAVLVHSGKEYTYELSGLGRVMPRTMAAFTVAALVCPLHGWLPDASVAPTPVTALLHAVAVVKSGVFAIARLIYFGFGADFLRGTSAQTICLLAAAGTILFGSIRALRTPHLKRRLAYSTVSNLSYIVLGLSVMSNAGLTAGLTHMVYHALLKIVLFFCAGAVLVHSGKEYTYELSGLGRVMPRTMAAFTVAALGLMGLPPLGGFAGKWLIATACVENGSTAALFGAFALVVSAVLTALYLLPVCINAFFPKNGVALPETHEADAQMRVPTTVLAVLGVALALCSPRLTALLAQIGGAA